MVNSNLNSLNIQVTKKFHAKQVKMHKYTNKNLSEKCLIHYHFNIRILTSYIVTELNDKHVKNCKKVTLISRVTFKSKNYIINSINKNNKIKWGIRLARLLINIVNKRNLRIWTQYKKLNKLINSNKQLRREQKEKSHNSTPFIMEKIKK